MRKLSKIFVTLFMLIAILTVNSKVYADEKSGEVDQAVWGIKTDYRGHPTYIKSDDYSIQWSTQLTNDLCWLRGDYQSYQAWYGFDNSKGTYEDGSMFWVRLIFKDSPDYNYYKEKLDDNYLSNESNSDDWIIIFGVTNQDGTFVEFDENNEFLKDTNLYIQIGDMWDKENVKNYLDEKNEKHVEYINYDKDGIKGVFAKVGDSSSYVGTVFGEGNIYIICGIIVILMASCLGIIIYVKKRRLKVNSSED